MNYYIVTLEVFNTLTKANIAFMHKSQDGTQRLIATTDEVTDRVRKFQSITSCSNYTFTNHSDWTGDGSGLEEWIFEEVIYIPGIDD
jgi:hypothetical protein